MVAEAIVDLNTKNDLQPGDTSPTGKELSEKLGIGNTSPREGIRQPEAIGLLSSQRGGGVFVKEITIESILRQIVSTLADRNSRLAGKALEQHLKEIEEVLGKDL
jgi:DNA-binding FadR family transcriptional regulator